MSDYDSTQVSEWLQEGIAAAKAGRREAARQLLMRVVEVNERSEQAWMWLSGVVDTDEDRLVCLENVLTLNPDNVQAQAGLKWLQQRGVVPSPDVQPDEATGTEAAAEVEELPSSSTLEPAQATALPSHSEPAAEAFMTPEGCAYCGLVVDDKDVRCPHCGGQLVTRQFKREERSPLAYTLHAYWLLLAGVNVVDFFLIGYVWENQGNITTLLEPFLRYAVGPVVTADRSMATLLEPDLFVQVVRYGLLGLAFLGALVALGLFLRLPRAHALGLALIAVHLLLGLALFALGFLGYLMLAFRALLTIMLIIFMFNTVEDFAKEERRERLEPDRHAQNDVDFYARGRIYQKRGMWAKALLHWRRAAAMDPHRDTYFGALARAYASLGRYEKALEQVDQAIKVSRTPQDWQTLRDMILEAGRKATAA